MTKLKQFCSVRIEMYRSQICEPEDTWPNSVGSLSVMYLIGTRICNHAEATRFGSLFLLRKERLVTRLAYGWSEWDGEAHKYHDSLYLNRCLETESIKCHTS